MIKNNKKLSQMKREGLAEWNNDVNEFWRIFYTVSRYTGVTKSNIQMPDGIKGSRKREYVIARHLISYFAYNTDRITLAFIGANMGNRDHSTAYHGWITSVEQRDVDYIYKTMILELEAILMKAYQEENLDTLNELKSAM
jgi:chromosomal replication initiation ATPase DnaA